MMMREWLLKANGLNPQFRPICGFQPVYEVDAQMMNVILEEALTADYFDCLYACNEVEVYSMCILRKDSYIRFHDVRFIAALVGHEAWLISAGLIAVNFDRQLDPQIKRAKKQLADAIRDVWGIDIRIPKK